MKNILPQEVVPLAKCMREFGEMMHGSHEGNLEFNKYCLELKILMGKLITSQRNQEEQHCEVIQESLKGCKIFFGDNIAFLNGKILTSTGISKQRKVEILAFMS